jgi:hypothetical protein
MLMPPTDLHPIAQDRANTARFPRLCNCARRLVWVCIVLAGLAVGDARAADSPAAHWQVVLAAGDDEEPVFDNAVRSFAALLTERGVPQSNIHRFSANPDAAGIAGVEPSGAVRILRGVSGLPVGPGDRCLVFITSHGSPKKGVYLSFAGEDLAPAPLAAALDGNCAAVPTVVIVSSCYSGAFAAAPMAAPNRIILTASRADRPSFGCQADRTYTVFDQCLLETLPQATDWRGTFRDTVACVRREERATGEQPSVPQGWFGAALRRLPLWF